MYTLTRDPLLCRIWYKHWWYWKCTARIYMYIHPNKTLNKLENKALQYDDKEYMYWSVYIIHILSIYPFYQSLCEAASLSPDITTGGTVATTQHHHHHHTHRPHVTREPSENGIATFQYDHYCVRYNYNS